MRQCQQQGHQSPVLKLNRRLVALLALLYIQQANAAWIETGGVVESRPGVKQMFVVSADKSITDSSTVKNIVLLLTGSAGVIPPAVEGIKEQKPGRVALRGYFAERLGVLVAVGLPSDQPQGLPVEWREGKQHVQDVSAVMDVLMKQYPAARVTVLGFSNGCRSASNVGAALVTKWGERLRGLVMLSCAMEAFPDERMAALNSAATKTKTPMLVVHHKRDSCLLFENVEAQAKRVDFITVDDTSQPRPNIVRPDCGNGSAHVFGGKEEKVYQAVVDWINTGKTADLKYEK